MNDEQEAGGERNSYGCSAADYDIHSYKYNRVLFHNMMGFMDLPKIIYIVRIIAFLSGRWR